jgi:hypothetical protein
MTTLMYALVVFYCTGPTECWVIRPFPDEFFATEAACARTIEPRAHAILASHFGAGESDVAVRCDRYNVTYPAPRR